MTSSSLKHHKAIGDGRHNRLRHQAHQQVQRHKAPHGPAGKRAALRRGGLEAVALRPDKARDRFVLASLVASFLLTVALCLTGDGSLTLFTISQNLPVVAASDGLSRLFSILMSGMWLLSGAFSFGYMAHEGAQRRFYAFYLLTLSALLGLCFAGTLVTMYLCFELMTLLSVALVLHLSLIHISEPTRP